MEELFEEFDTNVLSVSDFSIQYRGTRIDNVVKNEDGTISLWAGNLDNDKYAEELLPEPEEKKVILDMIYENF